MSSRRFSFFLWSLLSILLHFHLPCAAHVLFETVDEQWSSSTKANIQYHVEELMHPSLVDTIDDVFALKDPKWRPYQPEQHLQRALTSSWIRIKVTNQEPHFSFRLIELENTLHVPESMVLVHQNKDSGALKYDEIRHFVAYLPSSVFIPLFLPATDHAWVYVKVKSIAYFPIEVFLWRHQSALEHSSERARIEGVEKGIIVTLSIASLILLIITRSFSYFIYTIMTAILFFFFGTTHGIFPYQVAGYPMPLIMIPICMALFSWFGGVLFELKVHSQQLYRINQSAFWGAMGILGLYLLAYQSAPVPLLVYINLVPMVLMIAVSVMAVRLKFKGATLLMLGWFSVIMSLGFMLYQVYYEHPDVSFVYNLLVLGTILKMLWWKAALLQRLHSQRVAREREQQQALEQQKQVQLVQDIALKAEEKANHKLERLILERTQKLEQTMQELNAANLKLAEQSTRDSLTGIKNKKAFDEYLYTEGLLSKREQTMLSLVMVDIDHFKTINDQFGHLAGDHVLKLITPVMQEYLKRPKDFLARFGGEEFAIVLPNTTAKGALHVAELIRDALEHLEIFWDGKRIPVTASLGVSSTIIQNADDIFRLIDIADQGMYKSKSAGRNQVSFSEYKTFK